MTPAKTIDDALLDVEIAFRQLEFAIKLLSYCELDHITSMSRCFSLVLS